MPLIMWQPRLVLGRKLLTGACRSSLVVTCSLLSKTKRRQRGSVPTGPTNGAGGHPPCRPSRATGRMPPDALGRVALPAPAAVLCEQGCRPRLAASQPPARVGHLSAAFRECPQCE